MSTQPDIEPVRMRLPDGWGQVPQDELDRDVAFLAIKLSTQGSGFTASVVFETRVAEAGATLTMEADLAVWALETAVVLDRSEWAGARGPRLSQRLRLRDETDPQRRWLVRAEEYVVLGDAVAARGFPMLRATSTATDDQADEVAADFAAMLSELDSGAAVRTAPGAAAHEEHGGRQISGVEKGQTR